jgi:GT2 family glycosyltransferase
MFDSGTTIGVNLLTCNRADKPTHYRAMEYAVTSLLASDMRHFDWHLQVTDNGSTCPDTERFLQRLAEDEPRVAVDWVGENVGIARGRNRGYRTLQDAYAPEFLVEVHTDHVFPHRWLQPIIDHMRKPERATAGIIGSSLITGGGQWNTPRLALDYGHPYAEFRAAVEKGANAYRHNNRLPVGLSHPAVMRRSMIEALDARDAAGRLVVYDDELPGRQNFEDTELAYRAHTAGWDILIDFASVVYHHYHYTRLELSDHPRDFDLNNAYCQHKHGPGFIEFATATLGHWMDRAYAR